MQVDPKLTFYIGLITCIALVGSNASMWAGAIPQEYVKGVAQWNDIIGTVGTAVMTFLSGVSSNKPGPLANGGK